MRNLFAFLFVLVFVLAKLASKNAGKDARSAAQKRADRQASVERLRALSEQKREEAARPEQWRAAKRQQDDTEQVHSIRMDSCESKLESLRVLYEAGILDREEYAQRVARVESSHRRR